MKIDDQNKKDKLIADLESKNYDARAFLLGLDDDVEKAILKFIYHNGGIVTIPDLLIKFVYTDTICTKNRLMARIDSLITHDYLVKRINTVCIGKYNKDQVVYGVI